MDKIPRPAVVDESGKISKSGNYVRKHYGNTIRVLQILQSWSYMVFVHFVSLKHVSSERHPYSA